MDIEKTEHESLKHLLPFIEIEIAEYARSGGHHEAFDERAGAEILRRAVSCCNALIDRMRRSEPVLDALCAAVYRAEREGR